MQDLSFLVAPMRLRLWQVDLDRKPSEEQLATLSPEEHLRASRFAFERDRQRYLAAHCALRQLLAQWTGHPAERLHFEVGPYGKPALAWPLKGCSFNMSHSAEVALIAIAPGGHIGVDVERVREIPDTQLLAARHFTTREREELNRVPEGCLRQMAFLHGWTRKEACLKALGSGLNIEPCTFETRLGPELKLVHIHDTSRVVQVQVQSFHHGRGIVGAIAHTVEAPPRSCVGTSSRMALA